MGPPPWTSKTLRTLLQLRGLMMCWRQKNLQSGGCDMLSLNKNNVVWASLCFNDCVVSMDVKNPQVRRCLLCHPISFVRSL